MQSPPLKKLWDNIILIQLINELCIVGVLDKGDPLTDSVIYLKGPCRLLINYQEKIAKMVSFLPGVSSHTSIPFHTHLIVCHTTEVLPYFKKKYLRDIFGVEIELYEQAGAENEFSNVIEIR